MKQDFESVRPGPSTGVQIPSLREAMKRAEAGPGRAIGLNAVEAATSGPVSPPPSLNQVSDELARLHDRIDEVMTMSAEIAMSLDAGQISEAPPWPSALEGNGIVPLLANRVAGMHHKLSLVRNLLEAAHRAI